MLMATASCPCLITMEWLSSSMNQQRWWIVNGMKSCIDLIFTNVPALVSVGGTYSKLTNSSDHHPIFAKFNITKTRVHSHKHRVWDSSIMAALMPIAISCCMPYGCPAALLWWCYHRRELVQCVHAEQFIPHYKAMILPWDKSSMNKELRQLMEVQHKFRYNTIFLQTSIYDWWQRFI